MEHMSIKVDVPFSCVLCHKNDLCRDGMCGHRACSRTVVICDSCEREYHLGCMREYGGLEIESLPEGDWFCGRDCREVHGMLEAYSNQGSRIIDSGINCRGYSWELLRGNQSGCVSATTSALKILRGVFEPLICSNTGRDYLPDMILSQKHSHQLDFSYMYTAILYLRRVPVCAAVMRVRGRQMAELPLIATPFELRRKGHCKVLLTVLEKLLVNIGVSVLSIPASNHMMPAWSNGFGFSVMAQPSLKIAMQELHIHTFLESTIMSKTLIVRPEHADQQLIATSCAGWGQALKGTRGEPASSAEAKIAAPAAQALATQELQAGTASAEAAAAVPAAQGEAEEAGHISAVAAALESESQSADESASKHRAVMDAAAPSDAAALLQAAAKRAAADTCLGCIAAAAVAEANASLTEAAAHTLAQPLNVAPTHASLVPSPLEQSAHPAALAITGAGPTAASPTMLAHPVRAGITRGSAKARTAIAAPASAAGKRLSGRRVGQQALPINTITGLSLQTSIVPPTLPLANPKPPLSLKAHGVPRRLSISSLQLRDPAPDGLHNTQQSDSPATDPASEDTNMSKPAAAGRFDAYYEMLRFAEPSAAAASIPGKAADTRTTDNHPENGADTPTLDSLNAVNHSPSKGSGTLDPDMQAQRKHKSTNSLQQLGTKPIHKKRHSLTNLGVDSIPSHHVLDSMNLADSLLQQLQPEKTKGHEPGSMGLQDAKDVGMGYLGQGLVTLGTAQVYDLGEFDLEASKYGEKPSLLKKHQLQQNGSGWNGSSVVDGQSDDQATIHGHSSPAKKSITEQESARVDDAYNASPVRDGKGLSGGRVSKANPRSSPTHMGALRCAHADCMRRPSFNFEGGVKLYCVAHKEVGMINVISKRCEHSGCTAAASFKPEGGVGKNVCALHKSSNIS